MFFSFHPDSQYHRRTLQRVNVGKDRGIDLTGRAGYLRCQFRTQMAIDAIGSQLRKLVYIMLWALGLFLISLIPCRSISFHRCYG